MRPLFLYGTLRHAPLREVVARSAAGAPGHLAGHGVFWAEGTSYPRIAVADGACEGLVLDASPEERARIDFYEAGFAYGLRTVTLADGTEADLYWPGEDVPPPGAPFDLSEWIATWGETTVMAASEAMWHFGRLPADALPRLMPQMRARAAARLAKRALPAPDRLAPPPEGPIEVTERRRVYGDFFTMEEAVLTHPRFDGGRSAPIRRAGFVGGDAVIVLPYDPVRDRVMLIEQIRPLLHLIDDPDPFVLEPIAGRIEAGDQAEDTARKEAWEEARLEVGTLHTVATGYPSPGTSTEYHHVFVAIADLPDEAATLAGLESEAEDIRSHVMDYAAFEDWLDAGRFRVLPLIVAGQWLARHRAGLRG
ncbi:MAG: NUDIX domain-containing protein [Shimia sp.]